MGGPSVSPGLEMGGCDAEAPVLSKARVGRKGLGALRPGLAHSLTASRSLEMGVSG